MRLEHRDVGHERVDDGRPSAVKGLVPDGCAEALDVHGPRDAVELGDALAEHRVAVLLGDEIHLVEQTKDFGVGRVLVERLEAARVLLDVLGVGVGLDIEHIDEHLDVAEDVIALRREVVCPRRTAPRAAAREPARRDGARASGPRDELSMNAAWPPQSQRLSTRLPRKRTCECSTSTARPAASEPVGALPRSARKPSTAALCPSVARPAKAAPPGSRSRARDDELVAPRRIVSRAIVFAKMIERIDVLPADDLPISNTCAAPAPASRA